MCVVVVQRNIGHAFVRMAQFQDAISAFEAIMDSSPGAYESDMTSTHVTYPHYNTHTHTHARTTHITTPTTTW
jgi:hypothetical protein